jgi:hypothetical protein
MNKREPWKLSDKYAVENADAARIIVREHPELRGSGLWEWAQMTLDKPAPIRAKRGEQISLIREEEVA